MTKRSAKLRKTRVPEDARIARAIDLPMYRVGEWEAVNQGTISEGDAYKVLRAGAGQKVEYRTIRRRSRFASLGLRPEEAAACEWYADAHAQRYDTQGITARYGEGVKSGNPNFDHLPKTPEQEDALADFAFARSAISPSLLGLFEGVVLHGGTIGNRRLGFAVALEQLLERIEGRVNF